MPTFKINPAGTYLADPSTDSAATPPSVLLTDFSAQVGSIINLSRIGAYKAGAATTFTDTSTSMVAVFVDASGNRLIPEVFYSYNTSTQSSGLSTNIQQDFWVATGGVTQVKVPTGAVALQFSVNDSFFSDNTDPNDDFVVTLEVANAASNYEGPDNFSGTLDNDALVGLAGNDSLTGGAGNDSLSGGLGGDNLRGGSGDDTLNGGEQRNLAFKAGQVFVSSDYDTADYSNVTPGGIRLDLSNMVVTAINDSDVGIDLLRGIESVYGTRQADKVVGSLAALSGSNEAAGDQHGLDLALYGGSDSVVQTVQQNKPWVDSIYVGYSWSDTAITAVFSGSTGIISYGAAGTYQLAGTDTVVGVSSFGDSRLNDNFDFSAMDANSVLGQRWNYVNLSQGGNDTVTGNGETQVDLLSGGTQTSTTGLGVNVHLTAAGTSFMVDRSHLSRSGIAMGNVTLSNINSARGTNFDDTLVGGAYDDFEGFRGKGGNDFIDGGSGRDRADYRDATDGVAVDLAAGTVTGNVSVGTDTLRSVEWIWGSSYDDVFEARGFSENSTNAGSNGDQNWFEGRGGNDTIYGNGHTLLIYSISEVAVEVNLATGKAWALNESERTGNLGLVVGTDTFTGVYWVVGSALGDALVGGGLGWLSGDTSVEGFSPGAGNDTVNGMGGWDWVQYTAAASAITVDLRLASDQVQDGDGGVDSLSGIEAVMGSKYNDVMTGSDTNNTGYGNQESFRGGKGNDTIDGGGGYDEVDYADDPIAGVTVNLATGVAQDGWGGTDTLSNIEGVEGSWKADSITGSSADNRLDGHAGNDTLDGGAGSDWAEYNQASGAIQVNLDLGTASGADGNDTLISIENIQGSMYGDYLVGDAGANKLESLAGADTLVGAAGDDTIDGGAGNDSIKGGLGIDTVVLSGNESDYTISNDTSKFQRLITNTVTKEVDTLSGVEFLQFKDTLKQLNNSPTGSVTLSGAAKQGQILTAANTLADIDGLGTISYQWNADGVAIDSATDSTFTLWQTDVGKVFTVTASYTDAYGTFESKTSSPIAAVADVNDSPILHLIQPGHVGIATEGLTSNAYALAAQSNGKLVLAGITQGSDQNFKFGAARLNADGSLDSAFGTNGKVLIDLGGSSAQYARGVIVQPDDAIILGGYSNNKFSLVRLTSSGALDPTFDTDGMASYAIGTGVSYAYGAALQSDGKIVLAGTASQTGSSSDFALIRVNANGSLDTSFGTSGVALIPVGSGNSSDSGRQVAIQADGKIIAAGFSGSDMSLIRLNANGSLDTGFSEDGKLIITTAISDAAYGVNLQEDGKILLSGNSGTVNIDGNRTDLTLVRLNANGTLDSGFGVLGTVVIPSLGGGGLFYTAIARPNGKIVISGFDTDLETSRQNFIVLQLAADGSLDSSFGVVGKVLVPGGSGRSAVLMPDGKVFVAGNNSTNDLPNNFGAIRLNVDGSLDVSFNPAPTFIEGGTPAALNFVTSVYDLDLAALNDGAGNYSGSSLTLSRVGGALAQDVFSGRDSLALSASTGAVMLAGVSTGTFTQSNGTLKITFNDKATQAVVDEVVRSLSYANTSDAPSSSVPINLSFSDGNTGAQGPGAALTSNAQISVNLVKPFVGLSNVKFVNDLTTSKTTVSFSITLSGASYEGKKVASILVDLDYDVSQVAKSQVSGVEYDSTGGAAPVWQLLTSNLSGLSASGKIIGLATIDAANPLMGNNGKTMDVTLILNQAVESFKLGINGQNVSVLTTDGSEYAALAAYDVMAVRNYSLKTSTVFWKGLSEGTAKALQDVSFLYGSQSLKSSSKGETIFENTTDSKANLIMSKPVSAVEQQGVGSQVNLNDAIAMLKMIVGLNPNADSSPLSPYQVVAADFNRDGKVSLSDALDVLKHLVGLSAPEPTWVILDQTKVSVTMGLEAYNADNSKLKEAGWSNQTLGVDLGKVQEIKLVGVLAGDLDGSWST